MSFENIKDQHGDKVNDAVDNAQDKHSDKLGKHGDKASGAVDGAQEKFLGGQGDEQKGENQG